MSDALLGYISRPSGLRLVCLNVFLGVLDEKAASMCQPGYGAANCVERNVLTYTTTMSDPQYPDATGCVHQSSTSRAGNLEPRGS